MAVSKWNAKEDNTGINADWKTYWDSLCPSPKFYLAQLSMVYDSFHDDVTAYNSNYYIDV